MNILIFSYYLYPGSAVGGMRAHMLAEGLDALGHSVRVVTAEQDVTGNLTYQRLVVPDAFTATRFDKLFRIPDVRRGWVESVFNTAMSRGMFDVADVVITSGGPFSTHLVGLRARGRGWAGAWVAEYRDLWSTSPYYPFGPVRRAIDRRVERRVLASADGVVAATERMARELRTMRPDGVAAIYSAVTARLVERNLENRDLATGGRCLRIAHAGYLYKGRRDVRPLLQAVAAMRRRGDVGAGDLEMHFFGREDRILLETVSRLSLQDCIIVHGEVPRDQLWRALAGMDALAVIRWPSPLDAPFIPGKLYEYVAFRLPILLVNAVAGGEAENLVAELACGSVCTTQAEIEEALRGLVREKRNAGHLRCPDNGAAGRFSQEHFIADYERVICGAIASRTARC